MDVVGATKRINGGTIGLDDPKKHYLHAMDVLGGDYEEPRSRLTQTIRKGPEETFVAEVQEKLNINPSRWRIWSRY